MNARQVFRLGHLQGNDHAPFLAFAAKLGGRPVIQQKLNLVSMRPHQRGAIGLLTATGLRQFDLKVLFHTRLIFNSQFLRPGRNPPVGKPRQGRKLRNQFPAIPNDLLPSQNQFPRESFQGNLIHNGTFQQCVAGAQRSSITLKQRQVPRMSLRQQKIQKTPSAPGGSFHQLEIFRAENHSPQCSKKISQPSNRSAVQAQAPFPRRPIHFDLVFPLPNHLSAHEVPLLGVANHLRAANSAKRSKRRHKVDGFQNVRLALGIVAQQQMKSGRKSHIQPAVIAEVSKSQLSQMHGWKMKVTANARQ